MMHGKGVYTWPDGRKYEGEYNYDKKVNLIIVEKKNWLNIGFKNIFVSNIFSREYYKFSLAIYYLK